MTSPGQGRDGAQRVACRDTCGRFTARNRRVIDGFHPITTAPIALATENVI